MSPERQRLEAVYAEHGAAVLAYARRRTDPATAEDVLSDVFLVAWRRIDELPREPRGWLLGVARKTLANQRRSAQRQAAVGDQLALHHDARQLGSGDAGDGDAAEHDGNVLRALATLSDADRELLTLIAWDELAPREAARVLGVSAAACTMRLSRARRRLAAALERCEADTDGDDDGLPASAAPATLAKRRASSDAVATQRVFARLASLAEPARTWEARHV